MTGTTEPAPPTRATYLACSLVAAVPAIAIGARLDTGLWSGGLLNPDSAMRLVRLNDIVAAGAPLHTVMRDASGAGTLLHWSHLLDSLLLLLAAPLAGVLGWPTALHLAGLASGPLTMGALGLAVAWTAAPVASRGWLWLGAFAAGIAPVLAGYGMLGVVHHHILCAIVAVVTAGWALRLLRGAEPVGGGVALGAWTGMGLWLSPETLPFALLTTGVLWASWLATPARRPLALVAAGLSLSVVAMLAWAIDPPAAGLLAIEPDRISLPFILLPLAAAATAAIACHTGRRLPTLLCGGGFALLWLAAFPQVLHGTSGLMTSAEAQAFFSSIDEMLPVQGLDGAMESLVGGLFAAGALAAFAWYGRRTRAGLPLLYAAVATMGLVALAALHVRFSSYPAAAGAILLPVVLSAISRAAMAAPVQSLARVAALLAVVATPYMAPLAARAKQAGAIPASCGIDGAIGLLASHPGEVVLAGVNETPDLLYRSRVRTVGSLYHRNPQAFIRLQDAWRSIPAEAPGAALRATGATLVLGCPHGPRSAIVDGLPHTTLLDRLIAGEPPTWLHRIADAGPGGYVLFAVSGNARR